MSEIKHETAWIQVQSGHWIAFHFLPTFVRLEKKTNRFGIAHKFARNPIDLWRRLARDVEPFLNSFVSAMFATLIIIIQWLCVTWPDDRACVCVNAMAPTFHLSQFMQNESCHIAFGVRLQSDQAQSQRHSAHVFLPE